METIKDLFIQEQSYIVEYKLNEKYYLWIEALSENGNTLTSSKFDKRMLENNILVELHNYNYSDSICEWYNCSRFDLNETLERVEKIMKYAIEQYESDQGDEE